MSGMMSKQKGKRGEREVVKLLQVVVDMVYNAYGLEPPQLERNLMQSHKGGYDVVGLEWMALEVKFHESEQIQKWWEQTIRQAGPGQEPVLFYRKSRAQWKVVMNGKLSHTTGLTSINVLCPVVINLNAFLEYFQLRIELELKDNLERGNI